MSTMITFNAPLCIYCPGLKQQHIIHIAFAKTLGCPPLSWVEFLKIRAEHFPADALEVE